MTFGFEPGPVSPSPIAMQFDSTPRDAVSILPPAAAAKLTALRQRARDLHATIPSFDSIHEVAVAAVGHRNRISSLTRHKSAGGFGLSEDAPQVVAERRNLQRAEAERDRLNQLSEVRAARWTSVKRLETNVDAWLLRGGVPQGCTLKAVGDAPVAEILRKNERAADAVARLRHRLRELAADLHRVRSSPFPSSVAKQKAAELIASMARAPDCDRAVEHGLPVMFPTSQTLTMARGAPRSGTEPLSVVVETPDTQGLLFWLFESEITAKVHAEIDMAADDASALSEQQRAEKETEITADMLETERRECSLIWAAERDGEILDFREGTSAAALLGVQIVTVAPQVNGGTSPGHAYDIVGR